NLFGFLQKHMAVLKSTTFLQAEYLVQGALDNAAFYTTDGMKFEFRAGKTQSNILALYEDNTIFPCTKTTVGVSTSVSAEEFGRYGCGGCGSLGLNNNSNQTTKPPCLIMVDVNGDRKPNPANINCKRDNYPACAKPYKYSDPDGKKLTDMFTIIITDKEAIPYGVAAQRAMYNSQK
ncbi:MAG: hypothetical protein Q4F80_03550, partial [bacterium]|nr:hypothetical protein [bacterium]